MQNRKMNDLQPRLPGRNREKKEDRASGFTGVFLRAPGADFWPALPADFLPDRFFGALVVMPVFISEF